MVAARIIEALDVAKDVGACFFAGAVDPLGRPFGLRRGEEAFHRRVAPHVSGPAHRAGDPVVGQKPLKLLAYTLCGFNRSSQHPELGGVDDDWKTEVRALDAKQIILASSRIHRRSTLSAASRSRAACATVLPAPSPALRPRT